MGVGIKQPLNVHSNANHSMTPWSTFPVVEELIREQTHPSMEKWIGWMLSMATAPTVSSLPILQRLSRLGRAGWWSQCPSIAVASDGNRFVQGVRGNRRCSQSQDWKGFCVHPRLGTGNGNGGETSALFQSLTRRPGNPQEQLIRPFTVCECSKSRLWLSTLSI